MEVPKEMKCTKCGDKKPLTNEFFKKAKGYRYGFQRWCRVCASVYSTELNKEKRNAYKAEQERLNRGSNIDFYKAREFAREMKKYGTTVEWFRDKLIEQLGVCAICKHLSRRYGKLQRLQVDHDHGCCDLKTKSCGECLRGLLCADCNVNLSYLETTLEDAMVFPYLCKSSSWTAHALKYLDSY